MDIYLLEKEKTIMDNHEFAKRLSVWLSAYTNEVIEKVMKNIGTIRSDDTTSQLLENLYQATRQLW